MTSRLFTNRTGRAGLGLAAAAAALLLLPAGSHAQAVATEPTVATQVKVGAGLYEVVVNESTNSIYVASTGNNDPKIFELDATTLAERRTIARTDAAALGLGINRKTQTLYTTNTRAGSVSAIDLATGQTVATIAVESDPAAHVYRALVDENANKVYVSVVATPSKIWIIDGATNTLEHVIEDAGGRTTGLALDPTTNKLYAAALADNAVVEIDLATRTVARTFPSGGERPTQMAIDPSTSRLFVTHQGTGNVVVLDVKSGEVVKDIPTDEIALGIGFDADADLLYVANRGGGNVTVIDTNTYDIVTTLDAGTMPNTVAIDSRDGTVFVTNKARPTGRRGGAAPPPAGPDEGGDTVTRIVRSE